MIQGLTSKGLLGFVVCASMVLCAVSPSAQAQAVYPLRVSANQRYLVDQNNSPFMIVGDSPQGLITDLSISDAAEYFANRAFYGFNAVQIHLLGRNSFGGRGDYSTYDGITPFTTPFDISTPRPAYFDRVDAMLNVAASNGIVVFLTAAETIDSLDLFRANGVAKSRAFGQYLGSRYKNYDNIVWVYGNDFQTWPDPNDNAVILAVANGIKDVDFRHLHTAWLNYFVSASRDSGEWAALSDIDFVYTYSPTYAKGLEEYALTPPKPVFLGEANYEGESLQVPLTTPEIVRRQEYWSMTSGATGSFYGHWAVWGFRPGWQTHYNSTGAVQMIHYKNLFTSRAWWNLVPDVSHLVLISGFGTYDTFGNIATNDYATAAMTPDSSLMIAYLPTVRTVTVQMSRFAGNVDAKWFDPSNGTYMTIPGSPFNNAGNRQFTPPGSNGGGDGDWVLLLETSGTDTTSPSITGVTVSSVTSSNADVSWSTNEPADTQVEYGLTASYGLSTPLDSSLRTAHVASINGLAAGTTYHYRVRSRDAAGNLAVGGDGTFSTSGASALSAQFLGPSTEDRVGPVPSPNGILDWRMRVQGLTSIPTRVQIASNIGGVWESPYMGHWPIAPQYAEDGTGDLFFEPLLGSTAFHVKVWYGDGGTAEIDAKNLTFKAQFLGQSTEDRVGPVPSPNGIIDWRIRTQGLAGTPTKVRITSNIGGVWDTPYSGHWSVAAQYAGDGTGDLFFDPLPGSTAFHVQLWYADGTTAEVDATNSGLTAEFLGPSGEDRVGPVPSPNGILDWQIRVQGLAGVPTKVQITSNIGGLWETPYSGHWPVGTQYAGDGSGDLFFEPLPGSTSFHVKVWYGDGMTAEADVSNNALKAQFVGTSSEDRVGPGPTPNGVVDWRIRLQGLLGVPTKVRITSNNGGVWDTPFSGHWSIGSQYAGDGTGDLFFDPFPGSTTFHVKVWYGDAATAEVDAN